MPAFVTDPDPDLINHPSHYSHPSGIECITVTRLMPFSLGNATKYVWRAGEKDSSPADVDLAKARFYLHDTLDNGLASHPPHRARGLLIYASEHDDNPLRAELMRMIAYGQLDSAIAVITELIGGH